MNQANNHNKNIFVIHYFYYCTKKLHEEEYTYTFLHIILNNACKKLYIFR